MIYRYLRRKKQYFFIKRVFSQNSFALQTVHDIYITILPFIVNILYLNANGFKQLSCNSPFKKAINESGTDRNTTNTFIFDHT